MIRNNNRRVPPLRFFIPVLGISFATAPLLAQGQRFFDDTYDRMPILEDRSWDGDLGDLNGDGFLDFVISNSTYGLPQIPTLMRLNSGDGTFKDSVSGSFPTISERTSSAVFLDVERDGDLDVYASTSEDRHYMLVNDGLGNLANEYLRLPSRGLADGDPAAGDVDGDMFLDILVPNFGGKDQLYINRLGYFRNESDQFPSGYDHGHNAAFGDVDGDFDLDAIVAIESSRNDLMINDGSGYFTDESEDRLPATRSSLEVILFDSDGDGDLDLFAANGYDRDQLMINNGSGYFLDESATRLPYSTGGAWGVAFGDIDNDADFDLIVAKGGAWGQSDPNRVWINDGHGYFTDETEDKLIDDDSSSHGILLGDTDGDGDLDLISINLGNYPDGEQNRLFTNLSTPDSFPPIIPRTYHHPDTPDTSAPYLITTMVWDNISMVTGELIVSLFYRSFADSMPVFRREDFVEKAMLDCGGFLYRQEIPPRRSGERVEYYIKATDKMGNSSYDPPDAPESVFHFLVDITVGIDDSSPPPPVLPRTLSLSQNYPNPFNPSTTINYNIPEGGMAGVKLRIYDLRGRLVRTLVDGNRAPGIYAVRWDGRDDHGRVVGSGTYLYRIESGSSLLTKKLILTR